ncbi:hypothetical protein GQ651_03385 [Alphaproteobacteria bacterium GH1-50]|uniref:ABC-type transport auxiliary lipoprotein component domain-containing protein n=1 Tax=Kangsaoukella pontilimi TaxID=2691042 RepID=A0A7C9IGG7_9RHOB|nr:PqiC family protein [Kangsaoukella pontilimi]MXQ06882.1 hypothetical protein [Kangsaoukella pontilimi]
MPLRPIALAMGLAVLTACGPSDTFYTAPQTEVTERIPSRYSSIEVLEVSLPLYASGEDVLVQSTGGTLQAGENLWADDPTRAVTLSLTRALTEITGARVAPSPWPFDSFPAARVDVRVERLLADESGRLNLSGQYFVADLDSRARDRARLFDLSTPVSDPANLSELLAARSRLVGDLAVMIARDGLG